jgi:chromosome segregation ATPase
MNATTTKSTVTNEDLLGVIQDLMQMTHDGFEKLNGRMDQAEVRLAAIETRLHEHDLQFAELKEIMYELSHKHAAYINDISDVLDRIQSLEERGSNITTQEIRELQHLLQIVVDWALKAARTIKVPLKLHK